MVCRDAQRPLSRPLLGFTLVEVLIVIVIGGILATISVQFIASTIRGVTDTANRQQLATNTTLVAERLSREIRQALPNSVRVFDEDGLGGTECIEFVPVVEASRYLGTLGGATVSALQVVSPGALTGFVAVYPLAAGDVYPNGATQSVTPAQVNFASGADCPSSGDMQTCTQYDGGGAIAQQFPADSPQKRFFITRQPVSFCRGVIGGRAFLLRYFNYGFTATAGTAFTTTLCPAATCQVMTNNLDALEFNYAPASLTRTAVVNMSITMVNWQNESLVLNQQVQVRNVP